MKYDIFCSFSLQVAFVELSREERTDETLFDQSKWASVSSELMAYLDAGQGTLLDITCAHDDPLKLSSIVINVIDIKVCFFNTLC